MNLDELIAKTEELLHPLIGETIVDNRGDLSISSEAMRNFKNLWITMMGSSFKKRTADIVITGYSVIKAPEYTNLSFRKGSGYISGDRNHQIVVHDTFEENTLDLMLVSSNIYPVLLGGLKEHTSRVLIGRVPAMGKCPALKVDITGSGSLGSIYFKDRLDLPGMTDSIIVMPKIAPVHL